MKYIVVPIDFSELSLKGLELAIMLASRSESKIELVHVIKSKKNTPFGNEKIKYAKVKQVFESIINRYKALHPNLLIDYFIREGKIHEEVNNQAIVYKESVIVSSTHGSSGWEELFTGSNAYKIVASSTKPVFTMRGNNIPDQINKIILPIDVTLETREKVPFTAKLAQLFKAQIDIVGVTATEVKDVRSKVKDYTQQVAAYLKAHGIQHITTQTTGSNVTDTVIDYAVKNHANLISIMTEQEKDVSNILLGSYAHQMINKSPVPVLLFPTKQIGIITDYFKTEGIYY